MADDSVSPSPIQDSTSPAPVTPPSQTLPPADIGQQPESTWPDSFTPAEASGTKMAKDTPADSTPSSIEPISTPSQEPISTVSADTPPPIPTSPTSPPFPTSPSVDQLSLRRQKANQARSRKKQNHLSKIMELARNARSVSNTDVQRLLHVSQSTATNYLAELASKGLLKRQGIRGGTKYTL